MHRYAIQLMLRLSLAGPMPVSTLAHQILRALEPADVADCRNDPAATVRVAPYTSRHNIAGYPYVTAAQPSRSPRYIAAQPDVRGRRTEVRSAFAL